VAQLNGRVDERGLTLTELAVVMILGTMIMAGLVGFYLSSQGLWLDASTQAITQREASLVATAVRDSLRKSGKASETASPDSLHEQLSLYRLESDAVPYYCFWWSSSDSLIHSGTHVGAPDAGPMIVSSAERFQVQVRQDAAGHTLGARVSLRLRTAAGNVVEAGTFAVTQNSDAAR